MDELVQFSVRSSDGTTLYSVAFRRVGTIVKVRCDCKAGSLGQLCRHKEGLMSGDASLLANPAQTNDLIGIGDWMENSDISSVLAELLEAELGVEDAKRRLKELRKRLTKIISD